MLKLLALSIACALVLEAADGWQKVSQLKPGADIRVFKKGAARPIAAKAAGVTDQKLLITLKKEEVAIDKSEIDRIDYHPRRGKGEKSESFGTTPDGSGNHTNWSSGVTWTREGWQIVYQRTASK
jgi:hypothetical protein